MSEYTDDKPYLANPGPVNESANGDVGGGPNDLNTVSSDTKSARPVLQEKTDQVRK